MLRKVAFIAAFSTALLLGCDDNDNDSKTPIVTEEEPELKVSFVNSYTDKIEVDNVILQWTSILKKNAIDIDIDTEATSASFSLDLEAQKINTEILGEGGLWGWLGCLEDAETGCLLFDSIDDAIEHEKISFILARGLDSEIYTEAKFIERLDDLVIDNLTFAVVDFEITKEGETRFDRLFYHLVDNNSLIAIRVETEFPIADLWPEVVAAIDDTVNSLRVTVTEPEVEGPHI